MSDQELVEAVRGGDTNAFSSLYTVHVRAVTTVVRANVHDREEVADAVQEVFSRALERLASLREPDHFRPWLLTIARHVAIDARRRRTKVGAAENDSVEDVASTEVGPDEEAELAEMCRLVSGSVAGLSRRDAVALSLVLHLGYSPRQVAAVLGVSPGAAKVILHRARLRLRDAVALEVLVRSHNGACADFVALVHSGNPIGAARHVHGCTVCLDAAGEEVHGYRTPMRTVRDGSGVEPHHPDPPVPDRLGKS